MTTRYVDGANGNDSWDGLSPNFVSGTNGPKKTLSGIEATPVVAGDLIHVRPGTYRELLTTGVSGSLGSSIEYRGDYLGAIWPSTVFSPIRLTGSDNDIALTRADCIATTGVPRHYRTFRNFKLDGASSNLILAALGVTGWLIDKCFLEATIGTAAVAAIQFSEAGILNNIIQNCFFLSAGRACLLSHTVGVDNSNTIFQNNIVIGSLNNGFVSSKVGGVTVKNNLIIGCGGGIRVAAALTVGQTLVANNNLIMNCSVGLVCTTAAEMVSDYNNLIGCVTPYTTVVAGAHDKADITMLDPRWFFNLVNNGAGPYSMFQMISPFDLDGASPLINVAGTSPSTTDMRGTGTIGAQREWGALEYDATLKQIGGVSMSRVEEMR